MSAAVAPLQYADGYQGWREGFAKGVRPRKRLTVSQWADAYRVLSGKGAAEPGPWRTRRVPYLREPMDALSSLSTVRTVVVMKAAQMGFTEIGLNWIGYNVDHNPGPMLVVLPDLTVRKRWSTQRLDPLVSDSPALHEKINVLQTRATANSVDMKVFPGGILILGGANSPASLSSMPIRDALYDEVDRFPWEVGSEGDPLGLTRQRQKTFARRKELLISSPTIEGASRIDQEYKASDQRRYQVPCPHCGEGLHLEWKHLQWVRHPDDRYRVKQVWYVCEHNGCVIEEHHKTAMLEAGRWVAQFPHRTVRGYHINGLYSPAGLGETWKELAEEFMRVKDDPVRYKRWVNTALGEPYEDRSRKLRPGHLMERVEPYRLREVPPGCLILTCGIDVQDDRLAVLVLGWGRRETCWTIDWVELPGAPGRSPLVFDALIPIADILETTVAEFARLGGYQGGTGLLASLVSGIDQVLRQKGLNRGHLVDQVGAPASDLLGAAAGDAPGDVWFSLLEMLLAPYPNAFGRELTIRQAAIDTGGHYTHEAYHFVRARAVRQMMAVKGANRPNKPVLGPRPQLQDVNWRGRVDKKGVKLWMIGTDTAKEVLTTRLAADGERPPERRLMRFSDQLEEDYFKQLTAEIYDPERRRWIVRRGRRNEAADCWVYGFAAAHHPEVRLQTMRAKDWAALEALLEGGGHGSDPPTGDNSGTPTTPSGRPRQQEDSPPVFEAEDPWLT